MWTQKLCSSSWILAAVCSVVHQEDGRNLSHICHSWRVVTNKIFLTWKIINCTFQPGIVASLLFYSSSLFSPFYLLSPSLCELFLTVQCCGQGQPVNWQSSVFAKCLLLTWLSLSPVCYSQVAAVSWSLLTSAASHLTAAEGSELAMISVITLQWWGKWGGNTCLCHKCRRDLLLHLSPWTPAEIGRKIFLDLHHCTVPGPGTSEKSR